MSRNGDKQAPCRRPAHALYLAAAGIPKEQHCRIKHQQVQSTHENTLKDMNSVTAINITEIIIDQDTLTHKRRGNVFDTGCEQN